VRWLLAVLVVLLAVAQYRLWFAEGSLAEKHRLEQQVREQTRINEELQARNELLEREVVELQTGNAGVEQRAREELGLVREGEAFYKVEQDPPPDRDNGDNE
jgi:cell division protein FtsB